MDNTIRSERTRSAVIQAALAIIARDGPGRLTLDAIARESGISKGGLMHQFRSKEAVLKALLEHQIGHFEAFYRAYMAEHAASQSQPHLAAQLATMREAVAQPNSVAFAIFGAVAQEPRLLSLTREIDTGRIEAIKAEAIDPDLALLRWAAAQGLVLATLFGLSPLSAEERERLFDRLLDDGQWSALAGAGKQRPGPAPTARKGKDR